MKITIKDTNNKAAGTTSLPAQFSEDFRPDLIIRAVLSLKSKARQPYGAKPGAGMRASAEISRRRRKYRGSYGFGISRVPRKILSRRGTRMYWVGAFAPGTVGGRRAHPPKAEKVWEQKINKEENKKAIRSALAATMNKELVAARGHKVPKDYPFAITNDFEKLTKTQEVAQALSNLELTQELERASIKTVRAGRGKARGRRYKKRTGPLLVVANKQASLALAARNIPGIDVIAVHELNAEILAPGTNPARLTLFTQDAIERLTNEGLFTLTTKKKTEKPAKEAKPAKVAKKATKKAATKTTAKKAAKVSA